MYAHMYLLIVIHALWLVIGIAVACMCTLPAIGAKRPKSSGKRRHSWRVESQQSTEYQIAAKSTIATTYSGNNKSKNNNYSSSSNNSNLTAL